MTAASPLPSASAPGRTAGEAGRRDGRIDMLRGLALMMIFVNHIPYNALSNFTLRAFGFSDAAEIFVFLAGYSAIMAYPWAFRNKGALEGWLRIGRRCATLWGVHALLLLASVLILMVRQRLLGLHVMGLAPLIDGGLAGLLRGLTLQTLPAYLDILPLYILLLFAFPPIMAGLRRSVPATLAVSLMIYAGALWFGWNLPNQIDARLAATVWTFNPFTWQLVFVLGATAAHGRTQGWPWLAQPTTGLKMLSGAVLVFGFLAVDHWQLWPGLAARLCPPAAFAEHWKGAAAPWRVVHNLALMLLLLTSHRFAAFSALDAMQPLKACGRFSLQVFSTGCILALLGRIVFADVGVTPAVQLAVNFGGIAVQLLLASILARRTFDRRAMPRFMTSATPSRMSA